MPELELLARGRTADVFVLDDTHVLRRYRDGRDVAAEAAVMAHVAAHGYAVPAIEAASGPDLVLERIHGPTLTDALTTGAAEVDAGARLLADLHTRLHALPPHVSTGTGASILHLDLHPGNVVLGPRGPVVIDWTSATTGRPELDVAMSALIVAEVAADRVAGLTELVTALVRAFVAHAGVDITDALRDAAARRADEPHLSADEVRRLPLALAIAAGR